MVLPNSTPEVSLAIWPIAAAARLLSPNVTPTDASIASPAWISTVLSTNPNATNGTALKKKTVAQIPRRGARDAGGGAEAAPPPAALANERGRADDRRARAFESASRRWSERVSDRPRTAAGTGRGTRREDAATAGWKAPDVEAAAEGGRAAVSGTRPHVACPCSRTARRATLERGHRGGRALRSGVPTVIAESPNVTALAETPKAFPSRRSRHKGLRGRVGRDHGRAPHEHRGGRRTSVPRAERRGGSAPVRRDARTTRRSRPRRRRSCATPLPPTVPPRARTRASGRSGSR